MSLKERVTITALTNEGYGVGDLKSGKKVFVPAVLPGEVCDIEIVSEGSSFDEGVCTELITASPDRILSYGNFVPGADLAHLSYESGLNYKEDKVRNCLMRIGHIPEETVNGVMKTIVACDEPLNYRNHMQYRLVGGKLCLINNITKMAETPGNAILEYEIFTKIREAIETVFLSNPANLFEEVVMRGSVRTRDILIEFVSGLNSSHRTIFDNVIRYADATKLFYNIATACASAGFRLSGVTLRMSTTDEDKRTRSGARVLLYGNDYYEEILLSHKFRIHAGAFFQVNIPQAELLYLAAHEFTKDAASILDLYCGTGSIGLSILRPGQKLTGIETVPEAVRAAKENALLNGISNATFMVKASEKTDMSLLNLPEPMAVIVDPPRKGLAPVLVRKLIEQQPYKICYISCDPATLARDLQLLLESGVYKLVSVRPYDMFPWTHHIETISLLTKVSD